MSKLDKINKLSKLFDIYEDLLTEKQNRIFKLYYLDDLSLSEIANEVNVSRNTILDTLNKTEEKLLKFESKINLSKLKDDLIKLAIELENDGNKEISEKIKKLI